MLVIGPILVFPSGKDLYILRLDHICEYASENESSTRI
jgi:hypothetical protein